MKYDGIIFDLDGTLLNKDKQISPANRAALERDYAVPNAFQSFRSAVEQRLARWEGLP